MVIAAALVRALAMLTRGGKKWLLINSSWFTLALCKKSVYCQVKTKRFQRFLLQPILASGIEKEDSTRVFLPIARAAPVNPC
jgi:hypothetical protein